MSRKRFLAALARRRDGRPVYGTGTSIACVELMDLVGSHFPRAHTDVAAMARLAIAGHTVLGMDMVMPLFSVCHEVAALGCQVNWGTPTSMPEAGRPIWRDAADIRIPSDLLTRDPCRVPLEAIAILRRQLGDSAAVCGKVFGPWTLSYHLFGIERFLMGTLDDPDGTRRILDALLPVTVAFARAQIEAGADCLLVPDHATRDLCSPRAYKDFLQELHAGLAAKISAPLILHICGDTSDRVSMIRQTGMACFHYDTKTGAPADVRQLAGATMALMGGVSNFQLLNGTPEQVREAAEQAAAAGIDIIGPECAVPLMTPLRNLKAITAV